MRRISRIIVCLVFLISSNVHGLVIDGDQTLAINHNEATIRAYDKSVLTVNPNADIAWVYAYNKSTININGGKVSWLYGYGNSAFNLSSGDISWLKLYENNITNISYLHNLSWLLVNDDVEVNIYGSDFSYYNGHLSGNWANGSSFSFWALEEIDLFSANIGHVLPDNIVLHYVPEPSSFLLMFFGAVVLLSRSSKI